MIYYKMLDVLLLISMHKTGFAFEVCMYETRHFQGSGLNAVKNSSLSSTQESSGNLGGVNYMPVIPNVIENQVKRLPNNYPSKCFL